MFVIIPVIDGVVAVIDQRIQMTAFNAERDPSYVCQRTDGAVELCSNLTTSRVPRAMRKKRERSNSVSILRRCGQATIMKDMLFSEINRDTWSRRDRADDDNWTIRGLRKSGRDYDEVECQVAIADFITGHQERADNAE